MINGLDGPKRGTGLIHGVTNSGPTLWTTYENISAGWEEVFSGGGEAVTGVWEQIDLFAGFSPP